ncbi:hypothetical protein D9758_002350 [Tetrapyrgos nigripes]|uniref:SAGA-associated factor 11 n=1 Tax=Tetrapyrgos nigripes TaxID=182062 RepID=A0A8H5GNY2_9AGAR|nr:hypothetical protein D9758_002350 [Tetrapyrgos nigripes]
MRARMSMTQALNLRVLTFLHCFSIHVFDVVSTLPRSLQQFVHSISGNLCDMPSKAEKAEKEEVISALTTRFFLSMLDEFVMDVALKAHKDVSKSRAVCEICQTRCNGVHVPGSSSSNKGTAAASRAPTPSDAKTGTGSSTPSTPYLDCVNCSRPTASNRYASHLSSCMGLSSARRGAPPPRNVKSKQSVDPSRSRSPASVSDAGTLSDDKSPAVKSKSKSKRAEDAEFNLKRKRPISPQVSPVKKQKQKASGAAVFNDTSSRFLLSFIASPVSRVKSELVSVFSNTNSLPSTNSQSKIPSKLRDSSTAPMPGNPASSSSRSSSPEDMLSATLGVASNFQSGARPSPPVKRPSPPRPTAVSGYIHEEEGDETGSSTDTDSD